MLHKAQTTAASPLIEFTDVSFSISGKTLVENCNFGVQKGSFVGLLGPNGAGKSSLLKLLYREKQPSSGDISVFDQPLASWGRKAFAARVGTVLQEKAQLSGLTIEQVVALGLFPINCSIDEEQRRVKQALELVELWDRRDENAGFLSGGEQQRLFFAQILALDPDVYLLDEPNNHLDLYFQYRLLDHIKSKGKTVIASFHDMNLAARYCDNAVLMNHGKIVASGQLSDVLSKKNLQEVFRVDADLQNGKLEIESPLEQFSS